MSSTWPPFGWKKLELTEGGFKLTIFAKFRESISTIVSSRCKPTIITKLNQCFSNYTLIYKRNQGTLCSSNSNRSITY